MSQPTPNNSDAVLGGQNPAPINAVVLGGLAGAKQRLESQSLVAKLQALQDTVQYGTDGVDILLQALADPAAEVKRLARRLLRSHFEAARKSALLEQDSLSYFTTLADWRWEVYNPEIGIVDPENNAYVVRLTGSSIRHRQYTYDLSEFEALIKDPRIGELQALIFQIDPDGSQSFGIALEAIHDARELFPHLRGLFVGDSTGDRAPEYRKSKVEVFDIQPFLADFPDLEILQVYGHFGEYTLECAGVRHEKLRTLIIETSDIKQENIQQIGAIEMPNLEYLELWLGRYGSSADRVTAALAPILSNNATPQLKYLGLCSDEYTDGLIADVLTTSIISQLAVLDFKMGTMTDKGVDYLLESPDLANLKYLNISGNYLSEQAIVRLQQLGCPIDASNPHHLDNGDEEDYGYSEGHRHWALHE
jgi:hypothetical protein